MKYTFFVSITFCHRINLFVEPQSKGSEAHENSSTKPVDSCSLIVSARTISCTKVKKNVEIAAMMQNMFVEHPIVSKAPTNIVIIVFDDTFFSAVTTSNNETVALFTQINADVEMFTGFGSVSGSVSSLRASSAIRWLKPS